MGSRSTEFCSRSQPMATFSSLGRVTEKNTSVQVLRINKQKLTKLFLTDIKCLLCHRRLVVVAQMAEETVLKEAEID